MSHDTSRWRADAIYDFIDNAGVDDLAWECLRRNRDYQQDYFSLKQRGRLESAIPSAMETRWGLRFRGTTTAFGK